MQLFSCHIQIFVEPWDVEARVFAEQLGNTLGKNFRVVTDESLSVGGGLGFGTVFTSSNPPSESIRAIARELKVLPLEPIKVNLVTNFDPNVLKIEVLSKPLK